MKNDARFILFDANTLKKASNKALQVFLKVGDFLEATVDGIKVKVDDTVTSLNNLWTSSKISSELSVKATIAYVDAAITGLKWKNPVIDFITQAALDALTPTAGDRYIITDGANINKIAEYGTGWTYTVPSENYTLVRDSDDRAYTYDLDSANAFKWVYAGIKQTESLKVDRFTLAAGDITAKEVTLNYQPTQNAYCELFVEGGGIQSYGVDYTVNVSTRKVNWSGLGLEPLLEAGDVLVISYSTLQ